MTQTIYTLLDAVDIKDGDLITAVDLVKSTSRGKDFGRACQKFAGFVAHSEQTASFAMLSKVKDLDMSALQAQAQAAPAEEPTQEAQAAGLLARGLLSSPDFGVELLDKFEAVRAADKTIVSHLEKPLSDLAWAQVGWEGKQTVAASYASFFTGK